MSYTYALIDGVLHQNAIKDLYETKEPIQLIPLYMGTRFEANQDLGPILLAALDGSNLIETLKQTRPESTTIIHSNYYLRDVAMHLSKLITVTDDTGSEALLRFADPLVAWYWLNSYHTNALPDVMGSITAWQLPIPQHDWQTGAQQWQTITHPNTTPLEFNISHLVEAQTKALDEAAAFKLKNEIYDTCIKVMPNFFKNQPEDKVSQWMSLQHKNAKTFGAITDRSYAMWYVMAMEFGNDFATNPEGIYQHWLTTQPKYKGLPAEVNIQHFFDERVRPVVEVTMDIT